MPDRVDPLIFYSSYGPMTDPGKHIQLFAGLPQAVSGLCRVVQGNLLHVFWAERYGVTLTDKQKQTLNIRRLSEKLALIEKLDASPLVNERPLQSRQVGNCRDFSLLLTAILRSQGIPARARCGFARYFLPGHFEDHWVCEYWDAWQSRWIMVDSQLDQVQILKLRIQFSPLEVPPGQFITGGRAWQMCRLGQANPNDFGIFDLHGWWFIWGNVIRDILALNKVEILPWDVGWGHLIHDLSDPFPTGAQLRQCDQLAGLSATSGEPFQEMRTLVTRDARFHPPSNY